MAATEASNGNGAPGRRAPGEGRDLLLEAAAELFAERGYQGASTREISERAGIAETLLFRNFGSKAALFSEVVQSKLVDVQAQWLDDQREADAGGGDTAPFRDFVDGFYEMMSEMRGLVLSSVGAALFEPETLSGTSEMLQSGFGHLVEVVATQLTRAGVAPSVVADEAVLAMITSMALFHDWLLPASKEHPANDEIVDELFGLILHGIRHRESSV